MRPGRKPIAHPTKPMWTAEASEPNLKNHYQVEYPHAWNTGRSGLPSIAIPVLLDITTQWGWDFVDGELVISFAHPEDRAQAVLEIDLSIWSGNDSATFYTPHTPLQAK